MALKKILKMLDITPEDGACQAKKHENDGLQKLAIAAAILLAVAFASIAFLQKPQQQYEGGKIDLFVKGGNFAGDEAVVKAYSSCGSFSLYIDGKETVKGETDVGGNFSFRQGTHVIEAKNGLCHSEAKIETFLLECSEWETRNCTQGRCTGTQRCAGGKWGACAMQKKMCVPGTSTGCSVDDCRFGYATCNECGTGFGRCVPREGGNASCDSGC